MYLLFAVPSTYSVIIKSDVKTVVGIDVKSGKEKVTVVDSQIDVAVAAVVPGTGVPLQTCPKVVSDFNKKTTRKVKIGRFIRIGFDKKDI